MSVPVPAPAHGDASALLRMPRPELVCDSSCKSRLQEYTQKAAIPLPLYQTVNEGPLHAPQFRSSVWVDGTWFISPNTFSNKKMAEHDAAKLAFIGTREKVKTEGSSRIVEDIVFCKSIVHEYAVKMNIRPPTYITNESKAMVPVFISSIQLDGATFTGVAGSNKKEAEQYAARTTISSILASETGSVMSEIVKSKFKFFDALKMANISSVQDGTEVTIVPPLGSVQMSINTTKPVEVGFGSIKDSLALAPVSTISALPSIQYALSESTSEQSPHTQLKHELLHVSKKPKIVSSVEMVDPPIVSVPPTSDQASENPLVCINSGKKRNRKKKKANKQMVHQSVSTNVVVPHYQFPAFPVTNQ